MNKGIAGLPIMIGIAVFLMGSAGVLLLDTDDTVDIEFGNVTVNNTNNVVSLPVSLIPGINHTQFSLYTGSLDGGLCTTLGSVAVTGRYNETIPAGVDLYITDLTIGIEQLLSGNGVLHIRGLISDGIQIGGGGFTTGELNIQHVEDLSNSPTIGALTMDFDFHAEPLLIKDMITVTNYCSLLGTAYTISVIGYYIEEP